ncbi:MAG: class IV adenylate cyclase [Phycisphaeraceae bacterium]|nr:MAG: class IV adenylate cyclase [Phycisphaeraceae bacterium]
MRNVEFKAELRDPGLARAILRSLGATWVAHLQQTDTYYRVASGRLKKRETIGEPTEFIHYDRADSTTPKISNFTIYSEHAAKERFGDLPLPPWVTVRKSRELFLLANVRIHLDFVFDLGWFIEFEALVSTSHSAQKCHEQITHLRESLAPVLGEPIAAGYSDLVAGDRESSTTLNTPGEPPPPGPA